MDEMKHKQSAYSRETTPTTMDGPPEIPSAAAGPLVEGASASAEQTPASQLANPWKFLPEFQRPSLKELTAFLKRTKGSWITAAALVLGLIAAVNGVQRVTDWARARRERRHEKAVATVTPDRLIARCGQANEDVTKEVFPIVMRTMSYKARGNQKLVVEFSRTAEAQSDWVFLSMNDVNGTASYETPDAKIAVLPCLDSTK